MVKDEQGNMVLSAVARMSNIQNLLQAKVRAILFGVKLLMERGILRIIVESAFKIAITMINRGDSNLWEGGVWIVGILGFAENFDLLILLEGRSIILLPG